MKRDIENRKDIEELVGRFYGKALADDLIGYLFTEVARIDLESHLPVIADFWEMMLFGTVNFQATYRRSPMERHHALNRRENLKPEHFARWIKLFGETIDERFAGARANLAKTRAAAVAETMRVKFNATGAEDL